jgi:hypothetical protein
MDPGKPARGRSSLPGQSMPPKHVNSVMLALIYVIYVMPDQDDHEHSQFFPITF